MSCGSPGSREATCGVRPRWRGTVVTSPSLVRQFSLVTCRSSLVTCHMSFVTCHLSRHVTCRSSLVTCHVTSPVTCHVTSPVTSRHLSPVTCRSSPVTFHLSRHVTCHVTCPQAALLEAFVALWRHTSLPFSSPPVAADSQGSLRGV